MSRDQGQRGIHSECRYWFFSGKGGVGKTSLSAATAVHFAEAGKRTLIITTDPASNLADVFEQKIGHNITTIQGIRNLWAMELDPDEATAEYKERTMAPLRGVMPESILKVMEEQLDSPCTSEMAVFERFVDFLDEDEFDVVIFDTAPTGHTLRLLQLPADWSQVIEQAAESGAATCVGPAQGLADSKIKFDRALLALKDRHLTKFIFVLRPEISSIDETARSMREIVEIGVNNFELVVNGIIPAEAATNALFKAKRLSQLGHLKTIAAIDSADKAVYLQSREIRGIECLRTVGQLLYEKPLSIEDAGAPGNAPSPQKGVSAQNRKLPPAVSVPIGLSENCRPHMFFFTGKGGVGKTLLSCVAAVNFADSGNRTLLVTTDPASHLSQVLEAPVGDIPTLVANVQNLWATRIDPKAEVAKYRERILSEAKAKYSADRVQAMEEELNSPCTEDMAVFYRFVDLATVSDYDTIVFDTAPTGHTLRLLRLPVEWNKQLEVKTFITKELSEADVAAKSKFESVIYRLQDPARTAFIMVVYPEHTPIIEAYRAANELGTIGITPALVIANQVLSSDYCNNDFFTDRLEMQQQHLSQITELFSAPVVAMPLLADEPQGIKALRDAPIVFDIVKEK